MEEARTLGKRLILSDIPVHREQDTRNCSYFALDDVIGLASLIHSEWDNSIPGPILHDEKKGKDHTKQLVREFGTSITDIIEA